MALAQAWKQTVRLENLQVNMLNNTSFSSQSVQELESDISWMEGV